MRYMGAARPMQHQSEDVERLRHFCRVNIWNGLGTGKTMTACWWAFDLWERGAIDEVILVLPSMCAPDWRATFCGMAMPEDLVEFIDCRPPNVPMVEDVITSGLRTHPGKLTVLCTTYGGVRKLLTEKYRRRNVVRPDHPIMMSLRGRKTAVMFDEAQAAALSTSAQGLACREMASASKAVASITATPIGRQEHLRLWGLTKLVRPDVLNRLPVQMYRPGPRSRPRVAGEVGSFDAFKYRFAYLVDPMERSGRGFNVSRAYPVSVNSQMVQDMILGPMSPYTVRRRKEDCLDLPPKVYITRAYTMTASVRRIFEGLVDDDRAVLEDGHAVVPSNILEERLRTVELTGGWLEGRPVHSLKLSLLKEVMAEISENEGESAPRHVWASRSREVIGCAYVAAGMKPDDALNKACDVYPYDEESRNQSEYAEAVSFAERNGVGIIHGPTATQDRDRIQDRWRSGSLHTVIAHPGVAGAGLNWQHSKASIYYSQPMGTIARRQSEDRVHRKGLRHTALIYDLVMEDGPDLAVARAHSEQRDAAMAMLNWLSSRIYR